MATVFALASPSRADCDQISKLSCQLVDQAPGALMLAGPDGDIRFVNKEGAAMFGYDKDEMIGLSVEHLVSSDLRSSHIQHRRNYVSGPQQRAMVDDVKRKILAVRKDGSSFPVEIKLNSLLIGDERLIMSAITDITERMRYEQTIARSNQDLEQFGHAVAHDLRAPIRQLRMYAEILEEDYQAELDADGRKTIDAIKRGANRATALIDDMLAFASLKQPGQSTGPVSLRAALDQALASLSMDIQESSADIAASELPTVIGMDIQLTRLFQNLIGNALKFCSPDRTPVIAINSISQAGGMVEVRINDNGIGVAKEDQARIFKMLERLHGISAYEGTGIGLASCKRIVELHGGDIGIESEKGNGSTFWFTLPLANS